MVTEGKESQKRKHEMNSSVLKRHLLEPGYTADFRVLKQTKKRGH